MGGRPLHNMVTEKVRNVSFCFVDVCMQSWEEKPLYDAAWEKNQEQGIGGSARQET